MHHNSIKAYYEEIEKLSNRAKAIYNWIVEHGQSYTDREIQIRMGFAERNMVQPRITELIERGLLYECGKTKCAMTGKTVRLVANVEMKVGQ